MPETFWLWLFTALIAGIAVFFFVQSFRSLYRANLMRDLPTSRVRSAAQGYAELEGIGGCLDGPPIVCPLSGSHCLWWKYSVQKRVRSGKNNTWRSIDSGRSDDLFYLDDGTGRCIIDPDGAQVIPTRSRTWYGNSPRPERGPSAGSVLGQNEYCYHEELIEAGGPLYAIGQFYTQASRAETDTEAAVRERLAEWKQDQPTLLKRFDVDANGRISAREWQAARRVAHMQIAREQAENPPAVLPSLNIMRRSPQRPYLLSGIGQKQLTQRLLYSAAIRFLCFLFAGGVLVWLLSTLNGATVL